MTTDDLKKFKCPYRSLQGFLRGGGQTFFRAFINSELGLPEVAPCMA